MNALRNPLIAVRKSIIDGVDEVQDNGGNKLSLFPNPSRDEFFVNYTLLEAFEVKIDIYSTEGMLFKSTSHKSQQGDNQIKITTTDALMGSGVYIVKFNTGTYSKSFLPNVVK